MIETKDVHLDTLQAVNSIMKKEGAQGLTVRNIAKSAGYSVGTFYNRYKNLDELLHHINGQTVEKLEKAILQTIDSGDSAKAIINKVCTNYIQFAIENKIEWDLLFNNHVRGPVPDWYYARVEQLFKKIYELFRPVLGGTKKDIEKAVKILWSGLHGVCSLTLSDKLRLSNPCNALELCQDMFHNYIIGYRIAGIS